MDKKLAILILAFFINAVPVTAIHSMETSGKALLPEDFIIRGAEGKLIKQDSNNVWLFNFNYVMNDKKEVPDVNEALEVLPTSALESAIEDANLSTAGYRLWGRVTKYKGRNFIFPVDFLPVGQIEEPNSLTPQQPQGQGKPLQEKVSEPNDDLGIPKEILEKLSTRPSPPAARRRQPERRIQPRQNYVLVNRIGFISSRVMRDAYRAEGSTQHDIRNTQYVFVPDALGRSATEEQPHVKRGAKYLAPGFTGGLRCLPCEALESAERIQSAEPEQVRFAVAGIVTEYKGCKYLLLERATRVYSHGNFGK